jgi:hypothetical protein
MITHEIINALMLEKTGIDLSTIKVKKPTDNIGMLRRVFVYLALKHCYRLHFQLPVYLNLSRLAYIHYQSTLDVIQQPINVSYRILIFECNLILAKQYVSEKSVLSRLTEMERELEELLGIGNFIAK